jgi:FkbM family methyltransferase
MYARHFPLQRGKQRMVHALWKLLISEPYEREVRLKQADVTMICDIRHYIQRTIYFLGTYEPHDCAFWMQRARQSQTIFDLGANVGIYSLLASAANPAARIHAFEPTPELAGAFKRNVARNYMTNIVVNSAAVGSRTGLAYLNRCVGDDGTNEGMNFVLSQQVDGAVPIQTVSIDDYCADRAIQRIDLMKLDIEGGELGALQGSTILLERSAVGCIMLELMDWAAARSGTTVGSIVGLLESFGYELYTLEQSSLVRVAAAGGLRATNVVALPRRAVAS